MENLYKEKPPRVNEQSNIKDNQSLKNSSNKASSHNYTTTNAQQETYTIANLSCASKAHHTQLTSIFTVLSLLSIFTLISTWCSISSIRTTMQSFTTFGLNA